MTSIIDLPAFQERFPHPPEPDERVLDDIHVFRLEDMQVTEDQPDLHSRRSYFKVSLVSGQSMIHYADLTFSLNGNALVFTNPMCPYQWDRMQTKQHGYVCVFQESFLGPSYFPGDFPAFHAHEFAVINLDDHKLKLFSSLFMKVAEELKGPYVHKKDLVRNVLMQIIHEAQKIQPQTGSKPSGINASKRVSDLFKELLERQFLPRKMLHKNKSILLKTPAAFAGHLGIHVNHLNKALKQITGLTTSQLINRRILQEAQWLLKTSDWSQADIAWYLGYEEPNHFSRFFKRLAHQSPKTFRQASFI